MKTRRWYFDAHEGGTVEPGDLMIGPRSCQVVVDAWPTETRLPVNRWTCIVQPLGRRPETPDEWEAFRAHGHGRAAEIHWIASR